MTWQEFGKQLILTKDLDPSYVIMYDAKLSEDVLKRFCLAYFCFYDMGTASRIAEHENFWAGCQQAYDEKWPRGGERRHYRGQQCLDSLAALRGMFEEPIALLDWLCTSKTFADVTDRVQQMRGFGSWAQWKIADILERVLEVPIDFSDASLMMYSEPVAGAALILGKKDKKVSASEMAHVLQLMQSEFGEMLAPPSYNRKINVQEFETLCCRWKGYLKGSYHIGKDSKEIRKRLMEESGNSELARHLARFVPVPTQSKTLW